MTSPDTDRDFISIKNYLKEQTSAANSMHDRQTELKQMITMTQMCTDRLRELVMKSRVKN